MAYRGLRVGPVLGLRREIDRLFEDTFGQDGPRRAWTPPADVREAGGEILIEVELPGIKPDDVDVTSENGVLTIRGEKRSSSTDAGDGRYHALERSYGTFTRSFQLPTGVDEQRIEADFEDGVLVVHVPKATIAQPRRIEIRNGGGRPTIAGSAARLGSSDRSTQQAAHTRDLTTTTSASPPPNTDSAR